METVSLNPRMLGKRHHQLLTCKEGSKRWLKCGEATEIEKGFSKYYLYNGYKYPRVTAVARKRPRSFCQKCSRQVTPKHAYTLDPPKSEWADYAAVQGKVWESIRNELIRN